MRWEFAKRSRYEFRMLEVESKDFGIQTDVMLSRQRALQLKYSYSSQSCPLELGGHKLSLSFADSLLQRDLWSLSDELCDFKFVFVT